LETPAWCHHQLQSAALGHEHWASRDKHWAATTEGATIAADTDATALCEGRSSR